MHQAARVAPEPGDRAAACDGAKHLSSITSRSATLNERRIVAFEALLRWVHPGTGACSLPDSFLNVIGDTGMLATLSWWVIEQACRQGAGVA